MVGFHNEVIRKYRVRAIIAESVEFHARVVSMRKPRFEMCVCLLKHFVACGSPMRPSLIV